MFSMALASRGSDPAGTVRERRPSRNRPTAREINGRMSSRKLYCGRMRRPSALGPKSLPIESAKAWAISAAQAGGGAAGEAPCGWLSSSRNSGSVNPA